MIRNKRRYKNILIKFIFFAMPIFILTGSVLFLFLFKKPLYLSPIPANFIKQKFFLSDSGKKIEKLLIDKNISYSKVLTQKDYYKIILGGQEQVLIDKNKSLEQQISSLQLLLARFTIEGKRFEKLDFRYNNPVVVFK